MTERIFSPFLLRKGIGDRRFPFHLTLIAEGADAELNDESVALFLRLGRFIGNDTPFRHIHCLPPNANSRLERQHPTCDRRLRACF